MNDKYGVEPPWYFSHLGSGRDVSPADLAAILTFTKAYSAQLWSRYISAKAGHLMMMDGTDWPNQAGGERQTLPWYPDNLPAEDEFAEQLAEQVPFAPLDTIYFFWGKYLGVETSWEIFLRYWPRFFFDDEGPILIVPNQLTAIVFCLESYRIVQRRPDPLEQPSFDELVHDLEHENSRTRQNAARLLGERGEQNALPFLIEHLSEPDYGAARAIAEAIGQLDNERAIALFTPSLESEDIRKRGIALGALTKIGTVRVLAVLKDVTSPTPDILRAISAIEKKLELKE